MSEKRFLGSRPVSSAKKQKIEAVEEAGDAEVLALGDGDFGAGAGVGQFGALALLQGAGDFGEFLRERLGDLVGGALGF